jgi:hypothetical protein
MNYAVPAAFFAAVAAVWSAPASAEQLELPQRQAGKWKLDTAMDEGRGPKSQSLTMCITEELEKSTVAAAKSSHQANCSRYDIKRDGDKTLVESECAYAVDKVTSSTEMTGDFKTSFNVKIATTTITTPPAGKPIRRERTITQIGAYLGADCGDIKPGEAVSEDGSRVMVQ